MHSSNRRQALAGALALAGTAAAGASVAAGRRADPAEALYRRALVINGNMVAPLDPDAHLDAATSAQVRASGISAFKQTLGGSGSQNKAQTVEELRAMEKAIAASPDLYAKVRRIGDIDVARADKRIGVIFSFEAGEMLEGKVDNIDAFRAMDVLVMGLSYNLVSPFASGVMAKTSTGLTPLGREAVARMNARGVTLDVSHSDEPSSLAAVAASTKPVLITHAGAAAVHPHPRNKSDALMRALADRGGVMGIYELSYLTEGAQPTLDVYMQHMTHALKTCGEDHVGIGTDGLLTPFDTSPESMKRWDAETARRKATGVAAPGEGPPPFVVGLNRPDRMEVIAGELLKRGYPARVAEKVLGTNFLRVFRETWTA